MRINTVFILLCFIVTFFVTLHPQSAEKLAYSYHNLTVNHRWWTLITALFVHGGMLHLLGNVLFMILFGYPLEKIIGSARFSFSFLIGGMLSFLLCRFFYPPNELLVGASGAICTLIAMLMLYDPWKLSLVLMGFPMPLGVAGLSYVLLNYLMASRMITGNHDSMHVAYDAHIIGFILGVAFSAVWNPDWKKNLLTCILLFVAYYAILIFIIRHFAS